MSNPTKHTPGPWFTSDLFSTMVQIPARDSGFVDGEIQVFGHGGSSYEEAKANARLIAAAPELLEALKAVQALALPGATHIHQIVADAIAKAEGQRE